MRHQQGVGELEQLCVVTLTHPLSHHGHGVNLTATGQLNDEVADSRHHRQISGALRETFHNKGAGRHGPVWSGIGTRAELSKDRWHMLIVLNRLSQGGGNHAQVLGKCAKGSGIRAERVVHGKGLGDATGVWLLRGQGKLEFCDS